MMAVLILSCLASIKFSTHFWIGCRLCQSGKCANRGTSIELNDSDLPTAYCAWPNFHNAVAAALAVRFTDTPADAWYF